MNQSERIRHIEEQARRTVSRNKCVDASLRTLIVQSKASKMSAPTTVVRSCGNPNVYASITPYGISGTPMLGKMCGGITKGKGGDGSSVSVLQGKQACAICSTDSQGGTITLLTPCIDNGAPPFTQQVMDPTTHPYPNVCVTPGTATYFHAPIFDGPNCDYSRITTPSA